jgi:hypothetical protein
VCNSPPHLVILGWRSRGSRLRVYGGGAGRRHGWHGPCARSACRTRPIDYDPQHDLTVTCRKLHDDRGHSQQGSWRMQ